MKEERHRLFDIWLRVSIAIGAIIAFLYGVHQFNTEQENIMNIEFQKIQRNDSIKSEQRIWENKVETYIEISASVGRILSTSKQDSVSFQQRIIEFEELYYGKSIMVEDSSVNLAMTKFKYAIRDHQSNFINEIQLKTIGMNVVNEIKRTIKVKVTTP